MRYISEIIGKDGENAKIVDIIEEGDVFTYVIKDCKDDSNVSRYTHEELKQQKDYKEILGVESELWEKEVSYWVWSVRQAKFRNLLEYVGRDKQKMPELSNFVEPYDGRCDPAVILAFNEICENKVRIRNSYDFNYFLDSSIIVEEHDDYDDYYECKKLTCKIRNGCVYEDYSDSDEHCKLICRVWKNCIYQNIDTNLVFISEDGDVYINIGSNGIVNIEHYRIKDMKTFNKYIAKMILLYNNEEDDE